MRTTPCVLPTYQTAPVQPAHFEKVLYQDLRLHNNALPASMENCTKLPALGLLVWQEVTRHSMRSSTFGQVQVPPSGSPTSPKAATHLLLQTGRSKVRQEIEPRDLLEETTACVPAQLYAGCQVATLPAEARTGQRPGHHPN